MLKIENIAFEKSDGLVPAIIQDAQTAQVLMLGYMNQEAVQQTLSSGLVTFFSRSKNRLWTKGEESGNVLKLIEIHLDCDRDTLLVKALPAGPTCHTGDDTCWGQQNKTDKLLFLRDLERVIHHRKSATNTLSYTASLFQKGINKIAQKVGEEAVELVIEAKDQNDDLFRGEAADLLFHFLVLLEAKEIPLDDILTVLEARHQPT
ncbi:MAG TPA: bifunctional phosphoribosyl-AMP cyclohydrolase/phosphoribosyl-ATP diphosphatase [Bacteroidetes bacterium]|nr:bifunctional phosphoribosyl-AMP cyclohydrolase/phosphoribosyl-ATP diphosphatase [Bacteroidota bacterium]HRR08696.1 bifunctional phosphoribosyl-AMP cyclohydrolase/phosphoribosyl-ATP diphosphatase HisIE [Rhodothermales bacterium]